MKFWQKQNVNSTAFFECSFHLKDLFQDAAGILFLLLWMGLDDLFKRGRRTLLVGRQPTVRELSAQPQRSQPRRPRISPDIGKEGAIGESFSFLDPQWHSSRSQAFCATLNQTVAKDVFF